MKTVKVILALMIVLSLSSCKKKKIEPTPVPTNDPIVNCNYKTTGIAVGKFYATSTSIKDTIELSFIKDNCPDATIRYKIVGLYKAFADYATSIDKRDYQVNINESTKLGNISDTMNIKIAEVYPYDYVSISMKDNKGIFTPYVVFKRI